MRVHIVASARKHGIQDSDIKHAVRHALRAFDLDGFQEFLKQMMSLAPSVFGWSKLNTKHKRNVCSPSCLEVFTKWRVWKA
jgi:hypothetical protein